MEYNGAFYLSKQEKMIKQPLISSLLGSSPQNQKVDVINLVNRQELSRVTKVDIKNYRPIVKNKQENTIIQQESIIFNKNEQGQNQNQRNIPKKSREQSYQNRITQTFLNNYENNAFLGFALYLAFMLFNSAQVITSSYLVSHPQNNTLFKSQGIMLILFSQLVYYLIVRIINNMKAQFKIYNQTSITDSLKHMISQNGSDKIYKNQSSSLLKFFISHPYILLSLLIVSILFSQAIYCLTVTQSLMLFQYGSLYLLSTIYCSSFLFPVLITFFCSNIANKSLKISIIPYLLAIFVMKIFFQSKMLAVLSLLKIFQSYLQSIHGVQMFHLNQLSKILLLIFWCFFSLIKTFTQNENWFFKQTTIKQLLLFIVKSIAITISFLLTRIIALIFIKNHLYHYFYSQTHIDLAFVLTSILMYVSYFDFSNQQNQLFSLNCIIACCFLALIGSIIYLEGKQKEQLKIQVILDDQHG